MRVSEAAPRDAAPRDAAPRDAAPRDAAPRDAAAREVAAREVAAQEAEPQSVTAQARRAQVVDAAISVIAEVGLVKASFARIARRAGVASTRMISYHFADRDDLVRAVVSAVFARAADVIEAHLSGVADPVEQLREVIRGNVVFYAGHRSEIAAVLEIWYSHRGADGHPAYGPAAHGLEFAMTGQIFRAGQSSGRFARFDPHTMSVTLRYALNGAAELLLAEPDTDVEALIEELQTTFERATGA